MLTYALIGSCIIAQFFNAIINFLLSAGKDGLEAISLIESMLLREPRDRPTATAILRHPLFWNGEQRLKFFGVCFNTFIHI